ncbi:MAG: RDD family protein, partial [Verrucomicrobia bacterium]|nr:RDD family protein [Verrucomicrobiota bacterium]
MKTATLIIRTPEGIAFPLLLASPVTRCLAWSVDFACMLAMLLLIGTTASWLGYASEGFAMAVMFVAYFAVSVGYGIALEWLWRGQTLGKRLFRLRVMDAQGLRLQFSQIVIRNLLRTVDNLPLAYLVGGVACLLSRRAQRLGDVAANTIVVRQPALAEPDLDQLMAGKFNSLREHPHLCARLRQRVSPGEAAVALQALLRREE